jgi:hypothetical protein
MLLTLPVPRSVLSTHGSPLPDARGPLAALAPSPMESLHKSVFLDGDTRSHPPFLKPPDQKAAAELKQPELRPCAGGAEASGQ